MQFSTKATFTAVLLATSALAEDPAAGMGRFKGTRRFRHKAKKHCSSISPFAPAMMPPTTLQTIVTPTPSPEPSPSNPPPENNVVVISTTVYAQPQAPEQTPQQAPPPPPPAAPSVEQVQSTPTPAPAPAPAPAAPASSGLSSDAQAALDAHNKARAAVGLPGLDWDAGLASDAAGWAQQLTTIGSLQHSDQRGSEGENLYWQSNGDNPLIAAANAWVGEASQYSGQAVGQGDFSAYGHYTQIIWKSTTKVGMAAATDSKGGVYVVARYTPAGNYIGKTPSQG